MNHELEFIKLKTNKVYFGKRSVVAPLIKSVINHIKTIKFKIPSDKREAFVSATFLPSIATLKKHTDITYSVIICTSLSSNDKSNDFRISFIENQLYANIKDSSNWGFKEFKQYLSHIPNIITMTAPALRKDTHLTYDLFSSDDVIGEIYVPDMVNVFYTKLRKDKRFH